MPSNTPAESHLTSIESPMNHSSSCLLPAQCHPVQVARAKLGDTRGAVYLPVCDSPPSSPGLSATVSLFAWSGATTPASISSASSAPPISESDAPSHKPFSQICQQTTKTANTADWLADKTIAHASTKLDRIVSADKASVSDDSRHTSVPTHTKQYRVRRPSLRRQVQSFNPHTTSRSEVCKFTKSTDSAQDEIDSTCWAATSEDEDYEDAASQFLDPFTGYPIADEQLSLGSSSAAAYLRPNAFATHRDTLARLNYNQDKSMLVPLPVVDNITKFLSVEDYKNLRLASRQWLDALPQLKPALSIETPTSLRLPAEVLQQIFLYLQPCDFDAARHTCKPWFLASLDRMVGRQMLQQQGSYPAFLADLDHRRQLLHSHHLKRVQQANMSQQDERINESYDEFQESSNEEWLISKRLATESRLSAAWHGSGLSQYENQTASRLTVTEVVDFSKLAFPVDNTDFDIKRFTVSACGNFVLVIADTDIFVYSVDTEGSNIRPCVRLITDKKVLNVSMDTSSGRYTVAALLDGRTGMSWDVQDVCRSLTIPSKVQQGDAWSFAPTLPIRATPTNTYKHLGSADDLPRSVAICPQRQCIAFGCRTGIELHWIDAKNGRNLNRWFPLAAPGDYVYFLPEKFGVDSSKKLRLISSASDQPRRLAGRHNSAPAQSRFSPISRLHGRQQSITSLFFGGLPFPSSFNAGTEQNAWGAQEDQGVIRTVDCDHYRAIPLGDGIHMLFTDPATGTLCLGSDAPLGGPTKLVRKICMTPPTAGDHRERSLVCYAAGRDLSWGVRIVAAYNDGSVFLYNIPSGYFDRISKVRSTPDVWDEMSGVVGQSDLLMDDLMVNNHTDNPTGLLSTADLPTPGSSMSFRSLQVTGAFIGQVEPDVDDLQVDSHGGGLRLWIFHSSGQATKMDVFTPSDVQVKSSIVGVDGLIQEIQHLPHQQVSEIDFAYSGKSKAQNCHVHFAGLDGACDSDIENSSANLQMNLELLEELNKKAMEAHPDPEPTLEPETEAPVRASKVQLEVFTDWCHEFLLSPYVVTLE